MFFNKKKIQETTSKDVVIARSPQELQTAIDALKLESESNEAPPKVYADLAKCYQELGDIDEAIACYETCIEQDRSLGQSYSELLKLYNVKRRRAAEAKNGDEIQFYLGKIDDLMQLSKDVIRGKQ